MSKTQLALTVLGLICVPASAWVDKSIWTAKYVQQDKNTNLIQGASKVSSDKAKKSVESGNIMLKVDAKGGVEDASDLARRTSNTAQHAADGSDKVSKATSESEQKEIKAHVAEEHAPEVKPGKLVETVMRSEAAVQSNLTFSERFTLWKHHMVVKAQTTSNSFWQRTVSNSTARYPAEMYPVEFLTSYCREADADCWSKKPTDLQVCTAQRFSSFPNEVCRCSSAVHNIRCNQNMDVTDTISTAHCVDIRVYVSNDGNKEVQCAKLLNNVQWKTKLVAQKSDGPESKKLPWHKMCSPGYVKKGEECKRKTRYLTESCWGSNSGGTCAGAETSRDEYSTSCYKGKCMAFDFVKESVECSCSWSGWRFPFACSAVNDQCGGHPCTWNSDNGKMYCNYAEKQNWNNTGILTGFMTSVLIVLGAIFLILIVAVTIACLLTSSETKAFFIYQLGMAWAKQGTVVSKP